MNLSKEDIKKIVVSASKLKLILTNEQDHHGINHHLRVLLYSMMLCNTIKTDLRNKELICTAALYHDIGRHNDDMDCFHGLLSWKKINIHLSNEYNENELQVIKYLIVNHCIPDDVAYENIKIYPLGHQYREKVVTFLKILKDADSLDIVRFGCFDAKCLRMKESKKLIIVADYFKDLGDRIQDTSFWMLYEKPE